MQPLRVLVAAFALFSFLISGFAAQTHIHLTAPAGALAIADGAPASKIALNRDHKAPALPDDPAHCAFCQELLVAGSYVAPTPFVIPLPVQIATVVPMMTETVSVIQAFSHGWRGRGPPLD